MGTEYTRGVASGWTGWTMSKGPEGPEETPTKMNPKKQPLVWEPLTDVYMKNGA